MTKLSLNKAAAHAGKAKADILKALKSQDPKKRLSGEKNDKGHWEIDPAELDRFFGAPKATHSNTSSKNGLATPDSSNENNALEVEVRLLREKMTSDEVKSERERGKFVDEIENLRSQLVESRQDYRQALAVISDQREPAKAPPEPARKGFLARVGAVFTG